MSPRTSLSPAARTMPCDSMPINFAGFKFATMTIVFPIKASGSYFLPMPATICRCSVPTVNLKLEELLRFRHALRADDFRGLELNLHELIDGDLGRRSRCRRR